MTPLIDVVFILLMFFLLTAQIEPKGALGLAIAPQPKAAGAIAAGDGNRHYLDIGPDQLRLNGQAISPAMLASAILALLAREADSRLLLQPESSTSLQRFIAIRDRVLAIGVPPTRLMTILPAIDAGTGQ